MRVIGQAESRSRALARIPALHPDVVLLDVRLPDGSGIDVCRQLRADMPDLRFLMITAFPDQRAVREAVAAGAKGYLVKDIRGMQLVQAVREVGAGHEIPFPVTPTRQPGAPGDSRAQERRLLALLGEGLTNRQIAARMFLAEKTVKNYVSRLLEKLGGSGARRPPYWPPGRVWTRAAVSRHDCPAERTSTRGHGSVCSSSRPRAHGHARDGDRPAGRRRGRLTQHRRHRTDRQQADQDDELRDHRPHQHPVAEPTQLPTGRERCDTRRRSRSGRGQLR